MKPLAIAFSLLLAAPLAARAVDFKTEILPIFESRCFKCHGNGESKGSFSLDPAEIKKHIKSSGQISPERADRSMLMELLTTDDVDDRMPQKGAALEAAQIELIKTWINEGASIGDGAPDDEKKEEPGGMAKPTSVKGSWTNREGKAIEATLVKVEGANAVLVLADGRSVPYPIANLSDESQEKVKAFVESSKPKE